MDPLAITQSMEYRNQTSFTQLELETIRAAQAQFARDRDWEQYHTPRNLLMAFVGEVGELSEIFQWKGEVAPGLPHFTPKEREHVGQELSDCLLYLVRLADVCGVDLAAACMAKLEANAIKYPAERCKGSSAKYTAYDSTTSQSHQQPAAQQQEQQQAEAQAQPASGGLNTSLTVIESDGTTAGQMGAQPAVLSVPFLCPQAVVPLHATAPPQPPAMPPPPPQPPAPPALPPPPPFTADHERKTSLYYPDDVAPVAGAARHHSDLTARTHRAEPAWQPSRTPVDSSAIRQAGLTDLWQVAPNDGPRA